LVQKRIENGERILEAFEDIPIALSDACLALRTHSYDDILRQYVEELYETTVRETPKLIDILLRRHKESCMFGDVRDAF
jgi:hypothetical protein